MKGSIAIGVHAHAEPEGLRATLASLRAHAPPQAEIFLLPDGPDLPLRTALAVPELAELPQLATVEARGVPACWNRLVVASEADVLVLLESGARVARSAIELLVAALADPRHGLSGPSTNLAWNEQCAFAGAGDHPQAVAATAMRARQRFGPQVRPLSPLHSLADFCYVARRDVVAAVGAADEGYGLGPCWEMDYNIRAARAGFLGVWVGAAYVHRAPFTARRRAAEPRLFEASRRRYQDKFCARRRREPDLPYEAHCQGDGCADFAPSALIQIYAPLPTTSPEVRGAPPTVTAKPSVVAAGSRPLLSCILPTRDRRSWLPLAIRGFLRQDFTDAELVIVDDGESPAQDCVPDHPRIRYHRAAGRGTIGQKRNQACRLARGELIAHWDDDDWYAPSRLRRQVEVLRGGAELCGTSTVHFYQPSTDRAWRYAYLGHPPMLVGTALAYRRRVWERSPFAEIQIGEDVRFVKVAGVPPHDLADPTLCVATIHEANTSPRSPDALFWRTLPSDEVHRLLGEDLPFYRRGAQPLVSCIMPTRDRRTFVPLALRRFSEQDWTNRELIVVDDGEDDIGDLVAAVPGVRYLRLRRPVSIGTKRNLACSEARGELIAHWDDDDWYGPARLSWQVAPILAGEADVTGLQNAFVLQLPSGRFWTTKPELHQRMFVGDVHGGTIVFRRALFGDGLRYPEVNLAEDAELIRGVLRKNGRVLRLANPELFVYVRHGRNAWQFEAGRFLDPTGWSAIERPEAMTAAVLEEYRTAGRPRER